MSPAGLSHQRPLASAGSDHPAWRRFISRLSLFTLLGLALSGMHSAGASPSRTFTQELPRLASSGVLYFDLYNSTGTWSKAANSEARLGLPWGEVILSEQTLGYKTLVRPGLAGYLNAGVNSSSREASYLQAGGTYLLSLSGLYINLNPEVVRANGATSLLFNGAVFIPMRVPRHLGKIQAGGEFSISDQAGSSSSLGLGFRWLPKPYITVDIIMVANGGSENTTVIRTPAALRVNLRW